MGKVRKKRDKDKVSIPVHALMAYSESRDIPTLILILGAK
jgi:hypothetical protein